ncbi:MAG: SDR family oxidoreductase [Chloroflexi bacterium]|nr:SDR family oxidoreductase [Chloroflexota bacterium]
MRRVALITGGARGIGRGIALDLAGRGWSVAFCYRTSQEDAQAVLAAIRQCPDAEGYAVQADVSDPSVASAFVADVLVRWGHVDALVNCAGPFHRVGVLDETPEGWRGMFANNLDPVFYMTQAVAPGMIERGRGRIVNFGMANADKLGAQPDITAHYIAKVGVLILTRTLARTLAVHGITVNAVSPGFIDTNSPLAPELESTAKRIPAGYVGAVEDVVSTVRFLLSDEARYINGANIVVSGGWGL